MRNCLKIEKSKKVKRIESSKVFMRCLILIGRSVRNSYPHGGPLLFHYRVVKKRVKVGAGR